METKKSKSSSVKKVETTYFHATGAKLIPYVFGWVFGVFNLVFWWVVLIAGVLSGNKHEFIDSTLHKIVYIWGWIMIVLLIIAAIALMVVLLLGIIFYTSKMPIIY